MKNYYRILNVSQNATEDTIKQSFRALAKRYHPDKNPNNDSATKRFSDINEAYTVLSDSQKRAEYDASLQQEILAKRIAAENAANNPFQTQAQNRFQVQIQAQIQQQVQEQLSAVRDQAFKDGYARGYKDGFGSSEKDVKRLSANLKTANAEVDKLRHKAGEAETARIRLEQKLIERDKELSRADERAQNLENQLKWLRTGAEGDAPVPQTEPEPSAAENKASPSAETKKQQTASKEKPKAKQSTDSKKTESPEARAAAWERKLAADRQLSKPTLYGKLGLLIWADDEEIESSYARLKKRYSSKKFAGRLKKITEAYNTLSDKAKREEYNKSIGITDDKIKNERWLIAENKKILDAFRLKKAPKEFWDRFDLLCSLALAGDADAENELGEIYYYGKHVKRDLKQAVSLFKAAFEQKHPVAIYHLGVCYTNGEGVGKNKTLGAGFLRQAANLGYIGEDLL